MDNCRVKIRDKVEMEGARIYFIRRSSVSESDNVIEVLNLGENVWLPKATEAGHWELSVPL